ncbi:MAG: hypothetical protein HY917_03590, partial [Candidatus Diapherotrites archaeon]|nr:hypothetical protein [Candidatus Diapherotrites archaeon]
KEFGKIDGLTIGIAGDLRFGRTAHSLALGLSKFGRINLHCISPAYFSMPSSIMEAIKEKVSVQETESIQSALPKLDVLYMTRIQEERIPPGIDVTEFKNNYQIRPRMLSSAKKHLRIMHPLPRNQEIHADMDSTPHALYFRQAANGLPVREAILSLMIKQKKPPKGLNQKKRNPDA